MNPTPRVMLLIDADNVSADVMEQAVARTMADYGAVHVRRAYCNAETAVKQQALFKRLWVRPMVNLSAGKNSTDIALAVDAMDLVIAERPDVVVLVSSDSDFAPLVARLREKGCRVCGIGQRGKTGDETVAVYDHFIDLAHQGARSGARAGAGEDARPAPARKTATRAAAKKPGARAPAPAPEPKAAAAPAAAPAKAPARATAPRKTAARTAPAAADVQRILRAVPALVGGNEVALNDIAKLLRAEGLLGKNASSIKLFDKLPADFEVLQHPDRIRWMGARGS
ncbi:MAG: NYN domain-containing protein [Ramlibacter sp.]